MPNKSDFVAVTNLLASGVRVAHGHSCEAVPDSDFEALFSQGAIRLKGDGEPMLPAAVGDVTLPATDLNPADFVALTGIQWATGSAVVKGDRCDAVPAELLRSLFAGKAVKYAPLAALIEADGDGGGEGDPSDGPTVQEVAAMSKSALAAQRKAVLSETATSLGVDGVETMTKGDLVDAILSAQI